MFWTLHSEIIYILLDYPSKNGINTSGRYDRQPRIEQIEPLIFAPDNRSYYYIGVEVGKAFYVRKTIGGKASE